MRRFFLFLFLFFASLFFSQCEIGKISFALDDVLMFFINGKVEAANKNNKIQKIDKIELEAVERPEEKIQQFDEIKLQAKEKELNFLKETQELSILPKQRDENIIEKIESIELLEIVKPQIKPEKVINEIYFHGVVKPQNEIEEREDFLIKEKKREALRIHKNEKFGIVNVRPRTFPARVLSLGSNKEFSFSPKVKASKNNKIINGEKIQIHGKESAKVIELRETAKAMLKVLEEYENGYKEDLEYIQKFGLGEILQIKDEGEAIKRIMEIVKEKAKEERMKNEKDITKKNILDKDKIEEFMNGKDDFKCEIGKINKKFLASKKEFSALKKDHLDLYLENRLLLVNQQKLKDELYNIKEASGCNKGVEGEDNVEKKEDVETPSSKKNISKGYKESEIILDVSTRNKQPRIIKSGYSIDDRQIIHIQNLKEDRQSMRSSISRRMNFRPSSWPQNNRNSFHSFFDWKKFYTDPRQQKTFIYDDIYDILQDKVPNNKGVLKEEKNVITNIKECHAISLQFQNKNEGVILNNVDENETRQKLGESENKIFKKIDIKGKKDNKIKTRKSYGGITAGNTSKDVIDRNNRTTVIGFKGKGIKDGVRNFNFNKLNVGGKKLGPHTSFNTFNNKSTTFLSNSGLDKDKLKDRNIINNAFEQKRKKEDSKIPVLNTRYKKLSRHFEEDHDSKIKIQIDLKKEQLKREKNTSKNAFRNNIGENNGGEWRNSKVKIKDFLKLIKKSAGNTGNKGIKNSNKINIYNKQEDEKIQKGDIKNKENINNGKNIYRKLQQNIINRLTGNNAGRKDVKRDLNNVEDEKIFSYNSYRNIKKEKYTTTSETSKTSNNSNSFVSLEGNRNSINLDAKRLKEKKLTLKKLKREKITFRRIKKSPQKPLYLTVLKKKK